MDAAARTAHDSTLQPFSEMEHYKHADELPPEIMADSYDSLLNSFVAEKCQLWMLPYCRKHVLSLRSTMWLTTTKG